MSYRETENRIGRQPERNKELWIDWTHDAMGVLETSGVPEGTDDPEEIVDHMADVASGFADAMLDELAERFGETGVKKRRKRKTARQETED